MRFGNFCGGPIGFVLNQAQMGEALRAYDWQPACVRFEVLPLLFGLGSGAGLIFAGGHM